MRSFPLKYKGAGLPALLLVAALWCLPTTAGEFDRAGTNGMEIKPQTVAKGVSGQPDKGSQAWWWRHHHRWGYWGGWWGGPFCY